MTLYNITYWDGGTSNVIQCEDVNDLIETLKSLTDVQYLDVSTVHFPVG